MFPLIPTRIHGVLDYLSGLLLIAAPWLFGFHDNRAATLVPLLLGVGVICYSLVTRYELGLIPVIAMRGHVLLDLMGGLLLLASPWLFGFAGRIAWPHVTVGLLEIGAALFTATTPTRASAPAVVGGTTAA